MDIKARELCFADCHVVTDIYFVEYFQNPINVFMMILYVER